VDDDNIPEFIGIRDSTNNNNNSPQKKTNGEGTASPTSNPAIIHLLHVNVYYE